MRLTVEDICSFTNSQPSSRNFCEGERKLNSKHMLYCGIRSILGDSINFLAFCMQTAGMNKDPHEIEGTITRDGKILMINSSCRARASEKCKHCLSVLLYLSRNDIMEQPFISCTGTKCLWKIPHLKVLEEYKPKPLYEHECFKVKAEQEYRVTISHDVREDLDDMFVNNNQNSALYRHKHAQLDIPEKNNHVDSSKIKVVLSLESSPSMVRLSNLQPLQPDLICCEQFLKTFEVESIPDMCIKTATDEDEWRKQRQHRITGSTCYNLYTYTKNKTADWQKKSTSHFFSKSFNITKEMEHGIINEPAARKAYEKKFNVTVYELGLVVSKLNPWLAYSPDGVTFDKNGYPDKLIEIKCPFTGENESIKDLLSTLDFLHNNRLKIRHRYYGKIQLGMAILDFKNTEFTMYSPFDNQVIVETVPFDEKFTNEMLLSLKNIYYKTMLHYICENRNTQK